MKHKHVLEIDCRVPCKCSLCDTVAKLRPYGKDMALICIGCAEKDPDLVNRVRDIYLSHDQVRIVSESNTMITDFGPDGLTVYLKPNEVKP